MAQRLITHDGGFHGDDVVAVAILRELCRLEGREVTIVRSRDPKIPRDGDIIVDVGGRFGWHKVDDGGDGLFLDHHQNGGAGTRENGIPKASTGLVWESVHGHGLLFAMYPDLTSAQRDQIWAIVDRSFIAPIDARDCGFQLATGWVGEIRPLEFSAVILSMNPSWDDEEGDYDGAFMKAVEWATVALIQAIRRARGTVVALSLVQCALNTRTNPQILVLERFCPWQSAIFDLPGGQKVCYVVFPQSGTDRGTWVCQCVADVPGSFGKRKSLPTGWAGLKDEELAKITGVADAIFCHAGRFMCVAGSRDGALQLASFALEAE